MASGGKWACDFHDDVTPLSFQLQVTGDLLNLSQNQCRIIQNLFVKQVTGSGREMLFGSIVQTESSS